MMFIADATIERFIKEDIPYIDLTSLVLNMAGQKGKMEYICREEAVMMRSEYARRGRMVYSLTKYPRWN